MIGVLIRKGKCGLAQKTQGRTPHEDGGRD